MDTHDKKNVSLKYLLFKERRWRAEGLLLFFSILSLLSYVCLAANVIMLVQLNPNIHALVALFAMLTLLALFVYRQYNLNRYKPKSTQVPFLQNAFTIVKKVTAWLSTSTMFLCGFAVMVLFYLYSTFVSFKPDSKLSAVYVLCAAGLALYFAGLLMLQRLGATRKRLLKLEAVKGVNWLVRLRRLLVKRRSQARSAKGGQL